MRELIKMMLVTSGQRDLAEELSITPEKVRAAFRVMASRYPDTRPLVFGAFAVVWGSASEPVDYIRGWEWFALSLLDFDSIEGDGWTNLYLRELKKVPPGDIEHYLQWRGWN